MKIEKTEELKVGFTLKVISTQLEERHSAGEEGEQIVERQLAVTFAIYAKDGEAIADVPAAIRTIGFPADATAEQIKTELTAQLQTFQDDLAAVARSAKAGEANANAIEVAKDLDGLEI
jgi:DNA-binding transcriptional MerR regulator